MTIDNVDAVVDVLLADVYCLDSGPGLSYVVSVHVSVWISMFLFYSS